jgi:hypothetical protein
MASAQALKQRNPTMQTSSPNVAAAYEDKNVGDAYEDKDIVEHPSGKSKHSGATQILRCLLFVSFFLAGCFR